MPFSRRQFLCSSLMLPHASRAQADPYPIRPITLLAPFAAGTIVDVYARLLAEPLGKRLGQPVIVDNVPGAGGNVGVDRVARARPDGHTLVFSGDAALIVNPTLMEWMPFDTLRDLAPISRLISNATALVTSSANKAESLPQVLDMARAGKIPLSYASAGNGTASHRAGEMLRAATGLDFVHAPYNASPLVDVMEGRVTLFFAPLTALQQVQAGRLRALAISDARRSALAPEVPTMIELGFKDFRAVAWFGLLAPAGVPRGVIDRLHAEAVAVLRLPEVGRRLAEAGAETVASSPEEFRETIATELERWRRLLQPRK
ncbi:MAG: Bug family tripartite tricarboxylate transporter substrate binding protein [Curvibacter sp.]|jgi:tripartite-type tricarboxylate transporter receptor subunit TctC